jgi:hypothetical protein
MSTLGDPPPEEGCPPQTIQTKALSTADFEKFLPWSFMTQNSHLSSGARARNCRTLEEPIQEAQNGFKGPKLQVSSPLYPYSPDTSMEEVEFENLGAPDPTIRKRGLSSGGSPTSKRLQTEQNNEVSKISDSEVQIQVEKTLTRERKYPAKGTPLPIVIKPKDPKRILNVLSMSKVLMENFPDLKLKDLKPLNSGNGFLIFTKSHDDSIRILDKTKWTEKFAETFGISPMKSPDNKNSKPESYCLVAKGVPTDVSVEEIKAALVDEKGYQNDIQVERFVKKGEQGEQYPLRMVKLTLSNRKDTSDLYIHGLRLGFAEYKTECSKTNVNPTLCFRCRQFGHFSSSCTNKEVCRYCGVSDCQSLSDSSKTCDAKSDHSKKYCINCKIYGHCSSFYRCPFFKRELELANFRSDELVANQEEVKKALKNGRPPPPKNTNPWGIGPPPKNTNPWGIGPKNFTQYSPNDGDFPPLQDSQSWPKYGLSNQNRLSFPKQNALATGNAAPPILAEQIVRFTHDAFNKVYDLSSEDSPEKKEKLASLARAFTKLAEKHFDLKINPDVLLKDSETTMANWDILNKDILQDSPIQGPLDTPAQVHSKGKTNKKKKTKPRASSAKPSRVNSLPDQFGDSGGTT